MTKKEREQAEKNESANTNTALQVNSLSKEFQNAFDELETVENLVELTGEYISFEEGEVKQLIVECMTTITLEGKTKDAVIVWDKDGNRGISAATVLVNSCKNLRLPCPIIVTCKGEKRAAVGKYSDLSIAAPKGYYLSSNNQLKS